MPQAKDFTLSNTPLCHQLSGDDLGTGMEKLDPTPPFPSNLPTLLQHFPCVAEPVWSPGFHSLLRDCKVEKWLKWLFPSQTVFPDPALWLGVRLPKVTIHFRVHRDRYLQKPVLGFAPFPFATAVFHSEEPRNISPPFQEEGGGEKKKKRKKSCLHTSSHQEGIVFGLCSTFCYKFAWCDVCFGQCGGRAAAGTTSGSFAGGMAGPGSPRPLQHWRGDARSLGGSRRWNTLLEGLGCGGAAFCTLQCGDFCAGGRSRELSAEPVEKHCSVERPCLGRDRQHSGLMGLFHFNFCSKMTLCHCSQTRRQPSLTPHTRSFFLFCP